MVVYITTPKEPTSSAVLIICNIDGAWQTKIAAAGHYVVVPDFLENDFFSSSDSNDEYAGLRDFLAWHSKPKVIAEAEEVLKKLQAMRILPILVVKGCIVPLAVLGAEIDTVTKPEQVMEYGVIVYDSPDVGSESFVKVYKGVEHGWTTRYDLNDVEARSRAETAHEEIMLWFKNRLTNPAAAL